MSSSSIAQTLNIYDAVHAAIRSGRPLAIVYATRGIEVKERTITPISIEIGKRGSDLVIAEDSLRQGVVSFRIDRVVALCGNVAERN